MACVSRIAKRLAGGQVEAMTSKTDQHRPARLGLWAAWLLLRPFENWRFRVRIVLTLVLLLAERLAVLGTPYLFSRMVARLSEPTQLLLMPVWLIIGYGVLIVLRSAFSGLEELSYQPVSQNIQRLIAQAGLRHLHALSLRFHLERQTGALTRALERGAEGVDTLLRLSLFNIGPAVLDTVLTVIVVLHLFGLLYAVIILVAMLAYIAVAQWFVRRRVHARRARNEASSQAQHLLVDSLLNFETVRHFGNESHEHDRYEEARLRQERASIRMTRIANFSSVTQNLMIAAATVTIMLLAAHDIVHHRIGVPQFVLIGTYLRGLYQAIMALNMVYAGWRNARVDLEHLLELFVVTSDVKDPGQPGFLPLTLEEGGPASITFDHVHFGYQPSRKILDDISFSVPAGGKLAIVGTTGSGKSTIGRLLLRAYDADQGQVMLDGIDLKDLTQTAVRQAIGIVPQETMLFNDTIAYNIEYGRLGASMDKIEEAARAAQIHEFVASLPEGYQTLVGERGMKLSGGEKQRIAIARVILKDPRVLLLDEATSALDTRTEQGILEALRKAARARTTISIAHRLSTIQDADHILVLEKGCVVEQGDHASLLAQNARYAAMWRIQSALSSGLPPSDHPPA